MSSNSPNPVAVLGIPIDNVTMNSVVSRVETWIEQGGFHQIATANTDFLIKAIKDEELGEILRRCDLVMADGMPLVWTSRLLGKPLQGRVTGADLVPHLASLSARRGYRIFMLGARERSLQGASDWLEEHYPGVQIVGRYSPPYALLETMDHEDILQRIHEAKPDILLVAFGNPKQEKWLSMHRHRLQVPVCIGIGGSFDFLAGSVSRAPEWMQRNGFEWFYRTMQEPRRLSVRYLKNAAGLLRHLPGQLAANAVQSRLPLLPQIAVDHRGDAHVLRITGDFSGPVVARFEQKAGEALAEHAHIVVDLSRSSYVGPDALGVVIRVLAGARSLQREVWMTGLRPLVNRTIRKARLGSSLRLAPAVPEAMRRMEPAQLTFRLAEGRHWALARLPKRVVSVSEPFLDELQPEGSTLQGRGSEAKHAFRHLVHGTSAMSSELKSGLAY